MVAHERWLSPLDWVTFLILTSNLFLFKKGSWEDPTQRTLGQSGGVKREPIRTRPPRSPGGQSHVSAITRDTAFPETPKRRRFSPTASNLLPENDYDDYSDGEDDVGGGVVVTGRWSGGA